MDVIFADIETTRDLSLPAYKDGDPTAFPPPPYHRVEMVGALVLRDGRVSRLSVVDEGDEGRTIAKFVGGLQGMRGAKCVTFNGRRFDLPVLAARGMLHGLSFPWRFGMKRWETQRHEDIADSLADFGAGPATSLDAWSRMCGWPGKLDESGKNVEALLEEGKRDHVRWYCRADVVLTAALWMRAQLLRGDWTREEYTAAADNLLGYVAGVPELAMWASGVDERVWLLGERPAAVAA